MINSRKLRTKIVPKHTFTREIGTMIRIITSIAILASVAGCTSVSEDDATGLNGQSVIPNPSLPAPPMAQSDQEKWGPIHCVRWEGNIGHPYNCESGQPYSHYSILKKVK